mgnify:CR=1 FL=1
MLFFFRDLGSYPFLVNAALAAALAAVAAGLTGSLVVVRRTEDRQRPITIARLVHPGSRYLLEGSFTP